MVSVVGMSESRQLQTNFTVVGSVLAKLTKSHPNEGPGAKELQVVSHEEALLALQNSHVLCKGVQNVQGRENSSEEPKAMTKERPKAVKKLW